MPPEVFEHSMHLSDPLFTFWTLEIALRMK
jgi:hypothetical protein